MRPKPEDEGSPVPHLHFSSVDQRIGWIDDNRICRLEAGQHLDGISIVPPDLSGNQRDVVVFYDTDSQSLSAKQKRVRGDRDGTDLLRQFQMNRRIGARQQLPRWIVDIDFY